jgi:hypothetical protein
VKRYGFQNRAVLEHLEDELQRLVEPLHYFSQGSARYPELDDRHIVVPEGFVFDGASIPRLAWTLMPSKSDTAEEGCLHDYLFRFGPRLSLPVGFGAANWALWSALTISRDGWAWQRTAMWAAVSSGGVMAWRKWRRANLDPLDPRALGVFDPAATPWRKP